MKGTTPKKFIPVKKMRYLVTDQCFFKPLEKPELYNPYDKTRAPHSIQLVDVETGTIVNLPSGSIIEVIKYNEPKHN
jgi:hypothetical protein